MRFLLVLVLIIASPLYAQSIVSTQIHDIDMGQVGEQPLYFLSTGQVVTYPNVDKAIFERLKSAVTKKSWFVLKLNENKEIVELKEIAPPPSIMTEKELLLEETTPYTPSILKNLDVARAFFYDAKTTHKEESQCFNRAHVWTYEWRKNKNLYSSKIWLFFTRKFIRKYKFEWWFHVAPMVHVVADGVVKERVMDVKYARGPISQKRWTDIFMRDSADCPVVEKYSDHANYPETGSCFVMKSSMYYYQPVDLEMKEIMGYEKTKWQETEVKQAYLEAFDIKLGESHE
jgi:Glutaminase